MNQFSATLLLYLQLLGVLLIILGIILAAWAQSARNREHGDQSHKS